MLAQKTSGAPVLDADAPTADTSSRRPLATTLHNCSTLQQHCITRVPHQADAATAQQQHLMGPSSPAPLYHWTQPTWLHSHALLYKSSQGTHTGTHTAACCTKPLCKALY
jgi:hypothetical protein